MNHIAVMGKLPTKLLAFGKNTIGHHIRLGSVFLSIIGMVLLAMLCVMYFFQINAIATKGLVINELEKSLQVMEKESRDLQTEIAKIKSLNFTKEVINEHAELDEISAVMRINTTDTNRVAKN
jgi:hypothetical protein